MEPPHLSAAQAAQTLGISVPTLYAYVSRGLIRSETVGGSKRTRRYRTEDVRALKQRKDLRRNPLKAVEGVLHWGEPLMDSAITLIADGRIYYRGHDVLSLAATRSIEEVAALIWTGEFGHAADLFANPTTMPPRCLAWRKELRGLPLIDAFQIIVSAAAVDDPSACDLRPQAVGRTGARVLQLMAGFVSAGRRREGGVAQSLQAAWMPAQPKAAQLISAALILCADHELNVSSFTARCVASAGSSPYAVVTAGLAALQGIKHGRATERVEAFLREAQSPRQVAKVMTAHLRRGGRIPGFGHPLYPMGDPRARELLDRVARLFPKSSAVSFAVSATEAASKFLDERPTIDFALVIAARALGLAADGAINLFAIGRTVGWIGHAIEQYRRDRIIRPRARYIGEPPRQD